MRNILRNYTQLHVIKHFIRESPRIVSRNKRIAGEILDETDNAFTEYKAHIALWQEQHPGQDVPQEMLTELDRLENAYKNAMHDFYAHISEWAAAEDEDDAQRPQNTNLPSAPNNGGGPGNIGGPSNGGGPSSTGGSGGASGSGTVQFSLVNFEEFFMIIPYLLGFVSIIFAINPEIFMYIRLLITIMSNPAFKLYLYFKYIDFLAFLFRFSL